MTQSKSLNKRHRASPLGANAGLIAAILFIAMVAMLGGSSRYNADQLLALRPLSALFLGYLIYQFDLRDLKGATWPLILLLLFTALLIGQLIPMPPSWWRALPGREVIVEISDLVGVVDVYRPLSMVPFRTLNALLGMIVLIGALLVAAGRRGLSETSLLQILVGLGVINSILGILQILAQTGPLFFYDVTNMGSPVGFMANTNHSATLSSLVLVIIVFLASQLAGDERSVNITRFLYFSAYLVILIAIVLNRSRSGLVTCAIALIYTAYAIFWPMVSGWNSKKRKAINHKSNESKKRAKRDHSELSDRAKIVFSVGLVILALSLIAALLFADRSEALNRLVSEDHTAGLRSDIVPILWQMLQNYAPWGSGIGTFEDVYYIHEPAKMLMPQYVNQAHNDWLQFPIEGGVPALIIFSMLIIWCIRQFVALRRGGRVMKEGAFWISLAMIAASASLVDYPFRAPLLQCVGVWLVVILGRQTYNLR